MSGPLVSQLARFVLVSRDAPALARFYVEAFGATASAGEAAVELTLGPSRITIEHRPGAAPYPDDVAGWNPLFQHMAIVVDDMTAAYARLRTSQGWAPISTDGPVLLPASSGGVTAFKFRDTEGHPLEFLSFPSGASPPTWATVRAATACLGIDHSAISVADTECSIAFYNRFGLALGGRSLNHGAEQARLDAVAEPLVEVTGLAPLIDTPHLELLCYRGDFERSASGPDLDSVAATRLVWQVADQRSLAGIASAEAPIERGHAHLVLRDPDGHLMEFSLTG